MKQETAGWWVANCLAAAGAAAEAARQRGKAGRLEPFNLKEDGSMDEEANDAYFEQLRKGGAVDESPEEAASTAFLCAMPPLVSRAHTTAFIACVAAGLGHRYLNALEAKSLMYSAQLALAAHRPRAARRRPPPTPTPSGVGAKVARTVGNLARGFVDGK